MELFHDFGERYLKDIILLEINVDLVIRYTSLLGNPVHIVGERVWEK
jgi:hypothetical protein